MATEAIQSEYQILFNDAVKSVNTFINTLDAKLSKAGDGAGANISNKIERGFDGLGGRLGRIFDTAFGTVLGGAIQNGLGQINNLLTSGFDATINFDAQISSIKALTGATGEELEKIRSASLQAGKDTKFSALEAAQGFEELLKAGVSLDAILGGGLTAALDLAVAGELSVADAAEIASTGLNTFKKDSLDVAEVGNILAGAANVSATNVSELKFALSSVGVVAAQSGQNLKGTSTALALFAQNGLKGSDAGTSLKTFLNNLIPTTKGAKKAMEELGIVTADGANKFINANGSFKDLTEITQILNDSTKNLTESQKSLSLETIFGSDAIRAAGILSKTTGAEFDRLSESILKIKAADVAKEKLNNLKGAFETLKGSIETNQILLLGGLQPALLQLTKGFDGLINSIDFAKAGESISNFVNLGLKELGNLYNLLFKGDFTGLFGLGEDSKVIGFLLDIRNAFISVKDLISNTNFSLALPDFSPLLESVSGFGSSVLKLFESIGKNEFFNIVTKSLGDLSKALIEVGLPFIIDRVTDLFNLLASNQTVLEIVLGTVTALAVAFGAFSLIAPIIGIITGLGGVFTSLGIIFGLLTTPIGLVVLAIAGLVLLGLAIYNNWSTISSFFVGLWDGISKAFIDGVESAKKIIDDFWEGTKKLFNDGKLAVENVLNSFGTFITTKFNEIGNSIKNSWDNTINSVKQNAQNLVDGVLNTFGNIKSGIEGAWNRAIDFLKSYNLFDIGSNIIQGLINGIKDNIGNVASIITGGMKGAVDNVKRFLGIASPSKLFLEIGGYTGQGLLLGLEKYTPEISKAFDNLVNVPQIPPVPNPQADLSSVYNRNYSNINNNQSTQTNSNNNQTYQNFGNNYNLFPVNQYSF